MVFLWSQWEQHVQRALHVSSLKYFFYKKVNFSFTKAVRKIEGN